MTEELKTQEHIKGFFISVIKESGTISRRYSDFILSFLKESASMCSDDDVSFEVLRHDELQCGSITQSLTKEIIHADFFVVLIDAFDEDKNLFYEPNVWFELGFAATMEAPVFLISKASTPIPFDVHDVKTIKISEGLFKHMIECDSIEKQASFEKVHEIVKTWLGTDNTFKIAQKFNDEILSQFRLIKDNPYSPFQALYESEVLKKHTGLYSFSQLLRKIESWGERGSKFISGEERAFAELTNAIAEAHSSLYTTRFANQSIVSNPQKWHNNFMDTLYTVSGSLEVCDRIICNNSPEKWKDIFYAIVYGGKNMRVFVRACSFSTHFELVVIDRTIAFIHFYDKSLEEDANEKVNSIEQNSVAKMSINGAFVERAQKINSTLRLEGDVCEKLIKLFDRLHNKRVHRYSHTILGIDDSCDQMELYHQNYGKIGVFQLIDEYGNSAQQQSRKRKDAFDLLIKTYNYNIERMKSGNDTLQNFTLSDAWIMYRGLISLGKELNWDANINPPSASCPEEIEYLIGE